MLRAAYSWWGLHVESSSSCATPSIVKKEKLSKEEEEASAESKSVRAVEVRRVFDALRYKVDPKLEII